MGNDPMYESFQWCETAIYYLSLMLVAIKVGLLVRKWNCFLEKQIEIVFYRMNNYI
jgi:hypothetical protein